MFSYLHLVYIYLYLFVFSENKKLFWLGGLYRRTIMSCFLKRTFILRYMGSVSMSICKVNCLDTILFLTHMHSPPPKHFLSHPNISYHVTHLFPMQPFSTPWKYQKILRSWNGALGTNGLIENWYLGKDSSIFVTETKNVPKMDW